MAVKIKHKNGPQSARLTGMQTVHYLHNTFKPSDLTQEGVTTADLTCKIKLGTIPAYALALETYVRVNTACTGNVIVVGTSSGASVNDVVSTADVLGATTGLYVVDRYMGTQSTVDQTLYICTITTACTAGLVDIWQTYLPVNQPTTF